MSAPPVQQINASDLDLNQLAEVRRQLDQEITHLTNSFAQLKQAQAKFSSCIDNVSEINSTNKDKTILVPLTNSLYVPGKITETESVVVDVGTGYYVRKTREQAKAYYSSKAEYIRTNLEALQETITKKQESMTYLVGIMQTKLKESGTGGAAAIEGSTSGNGGAVGARS